MEEIYQVQEVGLSFYAYQILIHALTRRSRLYFLGIFWTLVACTFAIRVTICVNRAIDLVHDSEQLQEHIAMLHTGYFTLVALIETCSSAFLLSILIKAQGRRHGGGGGGSSFSSSPMSKVFRHLIRATELRLASLCLIGITRAVTYSFQRNTFQGAVTLSGQFDRFVYTLECLFPFVMLYVFFCLSLFVVYNADLFVRVDILASKAVNGTEVMRKESTRPFTRHIEIVDYGDAS